MKSFLIAVVMAAAACGAGGTTAPVEHKPAPRMSDPTCPLEVPGTSVSVEDTTNGAALVFVTTGDVPSVRSRVARLADVHNTRKGDGGWLGMMFAAGPTATATEITDGGRVELAAAQPDGAAEIQRMLRMHASHLSSGSCEM